MCEVRFCFLFPLLRRARGFLSFSISKTLIGLTVHLVQTKAKYFKQIGTKTKLEIGLQLERTRSNSLTLN